MAADVMTMTKQEKRVVELLEQLSARAEPLSVTEAPRWLREKSLVLKARALELTPQGVDAKLVASAVADCLELPISFGSLRLSDEVWRVVLTRLDQRRRDAGPAATFLLEATRGVSATNAGTSCRLAMEAYEALHEMKSFGSARARRVLAGLTARPELVRACQALVVGDPLARLSMVAVLVLDGSAESIDALLQFLQYEPSERDCRALARLVPAKSDIAKLLLEPRKTGASAAAFSKALGLHAGHSKVEVWFGSRLANGEEGRLSGTFTLDPTARAWWWVYLEREHRTRLFETEGELAFGAEGVGENSLNAKPPSAIDEVPTWLAAFGQRNKVSWLLQRVDGRLSRKGKDQLAKWLRVVADGD